MENQDTGILLNKTNITLNRQYFKEMVRLLGITVLYRAPMENKHYDFYGDLDSNFYLPQKVGCVFDEHPNIWTMKKLGWATQVNPTDSVIHVPYDLDKLQVGALFIIPSGIDNSVGRLFQVTEMSTIMVYPASIACKIAPIYIDKQAKATVEDFTHSDFNLLATDDDEE